MDKNYNIMALQGYTGMSDQDFVEDQGMPQELAFTPEMNLWMTYHIYLGNKQAETPQETERLLLEQFINMRIIISPRIWMDMDPGFDTMHDEEWWMSDSNLLNACKSTYGRFSS